MVFAIVTDNASYVGERVRKDAEKLIRNGKLLVGIYSHSEYDDSDIFFRALLPGEFEKAFIRKTHYEVEFRLNDPSKELYAEQALRDREIDYKVVKSSVPKTIH